MSQTTLRRTTLQVGLLQIAIIILVLATALIHLNQALVMGFFAGHIGVIPAGSPPQPGGPSGLRLLILQNLLLLFFLNFIGYIVLGVALYLPFLKKFHRIIRWLLIIFTAITVIAYFVTLGFKPNPVGYADKIIEVALIVLLIIDDRKSAGQAVA